MRFAVSFNKDEEGEYSFKVQTASLRRSPLGVRNEINEPEYWSTREHIQVNLQAERMLTCRR